MLLAITSPKVVGGFVRGSGCADSPFMNCVDATGIVVVGF